MDVNWLKLNTDKTQFIALGSHCLLDFIPAIQLSILDAVDYVQQISVTFVAQVSTK